MKIEIETGDPGGGENITLYSCDNTNFVDMQYVRPGEPSITVDGVPLAELYAAIEALRKLQEEYAE